MANIPDKHKVFVDEVWEENKHGTSILANINIIILCILAVDLTVYIFFSPQIDVF